jgi:hypothetical protein
MDFFNETAEDPFPLPVAAELLRHGLDLRYEKLNRLTPIPAINLEIVVQSLSHPNPPNTWGLWRGPRGPLSRNDAVESEAAAQRILAQGAE